MGMVVPDTVEIEIITGIITPALTLKLFSNNYTPVPTSIAANFTEVAGGGYASKPLTFASWVLTSNAPSDALYPIQIWTFTGPTNAPGTVYGYYVIRNSDGLLRWAERFAVGYLPFSPIAGSTIKVTPRFTASSIF